MWRSSHPHRFLPLTFWHNQNRRLWEDHISILFNHGSTAYLRRDLGDLGLRAKLRSEYLQAEKDNISGKRE